MNIMLDSLSTQVLFQQAPSVLPPNPGSFPVATGRRLNTLLGAIEGAGVSSGDPWLVSYSTLPITSAQLEGTDNGIDVYVSFTRYFTAPFAYQLGELTALQNWVQGGGGLLLLTNHGPFQNNPTTWPTNDITLAATFGITLQVFGVSSSDWMKMRLSTEAPAYIANQAAEIVAHDSCIIDTPAAPHTSIAKFPDGAMMWDPLTNRLVPVLSRHFAILVPYGQGNVIVVGNSGMFADYGTPNPSCGLLPMADNLMFFLNCVGYLGGLRTIPPPGTCPPGG